VTPVARRMRVGTTERSATFPKRANAPEGWDVSENSSCSAVIPSVSVALTFGAQCVIVFINRSEQSLRPPIKLIEPTRPTQRLAGPTRINGGNA
jgi:hypothetical protein